MPKPITPEGRVEKWKRLWGTPRLLAADDADAAFEDFVGVFVPGHMEKKFRQFFGTPRAKFGNRFFRDDAVYHTWDRSFASLGLRDVTHVDATVIYAGPDEVEAHTLRGETRRTLKDLLVDDWHAACAVVVGGDTTLYIFIEPKMKGCIVLRVGGEPE
jgi:hypothetical protein